MHVRGVFRVRISNIWHLLWHNDYFTVSHCAVASFIQVPQWRLHPLIGNDMAQLIRTKDLSELSVDMIL
jgi:hypothetical protein